MKKIISMIVAAVLLLTALTISNVQKSLGTSRDTNPRSSVSVESRLPLATHPNALT